MTLHSLPKNFDDLEETKRTEAMAVYRRRLCHYHYITNTAEHNKPHYDALTDHMCVLRRRLFDYADYAWEGETLETYWPTYRTSRRAHGARGAGCGRTASWG